MLGYNFIPQISAIENKNGAWKVSQVTETGIRELEFVGKGILSITSVPENVPRIPAVRAIFAAKKKPVDKIAGRDGDESWMSEVSVEIPKIESTCEFLPIENMEETAKTLLKRLKEERYL